MDIARLLGELNRMCKAYSDCDQCPIGCADHLVCLFSSIVNPRIDFKEFINDISKVEKWSSEHPQKTRLQDFMEKHPNALTTTKGVPMTSPRLMGYCEGKDYDMACLSCEHGKKGLEFCWNLPVEEINQ